MYELIILGFLMRQPYHGYTMAKIINDMIGPFAKVSNGRLYPLLTALEKNGFIVTVTDAPRPPNERHQRIFALTDTGRERFHQVMMDTTSNPGEYRTIFWHKVPYLGAIRPDERLYLIEHYSNYCQTHIFHLTSELHDLTREAERQHWLTPAQLARTSASIEHILAIWKLTLENACSLHDAETQRIAQSDGAIEAPTMPNEHT